MTEKEKQLAERASKAATLQTIHDHAVDGGAQCNEMESAPWLREAKLTGLRQADSIDKHMSAVSQAVRSHYQDSPKYAYPKDVFDKHVVVQHGEKLYAHPYSKNDQGNITLGDPTQVEATYQPMREADYLEGHKNGAGAELRLVPKPAAESGMIGQLELSGDLVPLSEASVRKDGTIPIKIIQPGWGSSGYYSSEMLERDGPNVFTKGLHMYLDHPTVQEDKQRPERSVKDLAAVLSTDARWMKEGPAGPGLYADAAVIENFKPFVDQAAKHIGVSIRAAGTAESGTIDGRTGPIIKSLVAARSIDFVTRAGAGGQVLPLYEAARAAITKEGATEMAAVQIEEKELATLRENGAEAERLRDVLILREAKEAVATQLAAVKNLPEMTAKRLVESLALNPPTTGTGKDRKLDATLLATRVTEGVKEEMKYLASLGIGAGKITGMGAGSVPNGEVTAEEAEKELGSAFRRLGMSESTAKIAANGRKR